MAAKNKYAGLADVDNAAPEIYETPELTDDASTVQTNTVRTESPTPSDEGGDERLDRQRIDQDSARRRFEPSLVNAKDVNFSDTIDAKDRQSYRTRSRRRRRRRRRHDDDSDDSGSDEETLGGKIARLRREAEEVRLRLAQKEDGEFKDSVENQPEANEDTDGMEELDRLIRGLEMSSKATPGKSEEVFLKSLANSQKSKSDQDKVQPTTDSSKATSTISAIAAFSDRLTALEVALGLNTVDPSNQTASILPTIDTLSTQISTLTSTLAPTTTNPSSSKATQLLNLDTLASRIEALTSAAEDLTAARKTALSSLQDLEDARLRHKRARTGFSGPRENPFLDIVNKETGIHTEVFLGEQSAKISALYQVLPTITSLQPLLPAVLERLRSLNVIHAGAAEAREELDDVIGRQGEMAKEVARWREAVEGVEQKMEEMKEGMRDNVDFVGGLVKGIEEKVKRLEQP